MNTNNIGSNPFEEAKQKFEKHNNNNVFIIMRFGNDPQFKEIESTIKETLEKYNLKGVLAKDVQLHNQLWNNIQYCMDYCRYAIVVFERFKQPEFNPNVSLELGYMLALKRPCLLLKDDTMPVLPTDIVGHLYTSFNIFKIKESISQAIEKWLIGLGHGSIKPAEILKNVIKRTQRIVHELMDLKTENNLKSNMVIRQAGSLSSFSISEKEIHTIRNGKKYKKLLVEERELLIHLLEKGLTIRLIISPDTQLGRIRGGLVEKDYVYSNIVPRYNELSKIINTYIDNPNFQIVYSHNLQYQNQLILDNNIIFYGKRRVRERGFPITNCVYDKSIIDEEIKEFDILFWDNVSAILKIKNPKTKLANIERVKKETLRKLDLCKKEIESYYRN